jgi:hypothetical protein
MRKALKELALLFGSVGVGIVLLFISSFHTNFLGYGMASWGYPFAWHSIEDLMPGGTSVFRVYLGLVNWLYFFEDLAFWLLPSLAIVEVSSHIAVPYIRRKLKIHRSRKNAVETLTTNLIQTPDVAA